MLLMLEKITHLLLIFASGSLPTIYMSWPHVQKYVECNELVDL